MQKNEPDEDVIITHPAANPILLDHHDFVAFIHGTYDNPKPNPFIPKPIYNKDTMLYLIEIPDKIIPNPAINEPKIDNNLTDIKCPAHFPLNVHDKPNKAKSTDNPCDTESFGQEDLTLFTGVTKTLNE